MTDADEGAQAIRRLPTRTHSNFAARTARDETERLHRRSFAQHSPPADEVTPLLVERDSRQPQQNATPVDADTNEAPSSLSSMIQFLWTWTSGTLHNIHSQSNEPLLGKPHSEHERPNRPGAFPRPVGGTGKLGTFAGVFVPVTLNVLSILMFLRFGFILGQAGLIGMLGMLGAGYLINLLTVMSISAIATNGTVRGGGAYCTYQYERIACEAVANTSANI